MDRFTALADEDVPLRPQDDERCVGERRLAARQESPKSVGEEIRQMARAYVSLRPERATRMPSSVL